MMQTVKGQAAAVCTNRAGDRLHRRSSRVFPQTYVWLYPGVFRRFDI